MRREEHTRGRTPGAVLRGWSRAVGKGSIVLLLVAEAAAAARPGADASCPGGEPAEADLGIGGLSCHCSVTEDEAAGTALWRFRTEPEILGVRPGGPADGTLHRGDRVVAVDGLLITTPAGGRRWSLVRPGERVELRVRRDGRIETVELVAGGRCPDGPAARRGAVEPRQRPAEAPALPGLAGLSALSDLRWEAETLLPRGWLGLGLACACTVQLGEEAPRWSFHAPPTVGAIEAGGPASRAGIREGDLLVAIDGRELTAEAGGAAFSSVRPGQRVRFTVRRDGAEREVELVAGERPEP